MFQPNWPPSGVQVVMIKDSAAHCNAGFFPLDESEWSASHPGRFTPGERAPGTHWIGNSVDSRAGLDGVEKRKFLTLPGLELRPLDRPAHSQSLYRLRYSGSYSYQVVL
jgi:hypothetical protein